MNTCSYKEYRYIFTTTWKQASKHLASLLSTDWQREWQALDYLYLVLSFCVANFLFANSQNTTALHYRYDMQMYCTFVHFVIQHFPGLPVSGTHCIFSDQFLQYGWHVTWCICHLEVIRYLNISINFNVLGNTSIKWMAPLDKVYTC
jgi:hypothetical protein